MDTNQEIACRFKTQLPAQYKIPPDQIIIPSILTRYELSHIVNSLLSLDFPCTEDERQFDFIVNGELLRTSLKELVKTQLLSTETPLEIEYIFSFASQNPKKLFLHNDWISAVAGFSCSKTTVVSGCYDGYLRIFKHGTEINKLEIKAQDGPLTAMCVHESDSARYIISTGKDGTAFLWKVDVDRESCNRVAMMVGAESALQAATLNPSGLRSAVGGWDNQIRFYVSGEAADEETTCTKEKGEDKAVSPCDVFRIPQLAVAHRHTQCVTGLTWPAETILYSSSMDHSLRKWDLGGSTIPICVDTLVTARAIICTAASPKSDGQIVAFGSVDKLLRIWDSRIRSPEGKISLESLSCHGGWVSTVSWCPNSEHILASGSYDGAVKIWDIRKNICLSTFEGALDSRVLALSWFTPNMLASGGTECNVKLYEIY